MNLNKFYARLVLTIHFLIVLVELSSIVITLIFPWMAYVLLALPLVVVVQWLIFKDHCLLSDLENKLLKKSGGATYKEGCIKHYLRQWFSIHVTDRQVDYIMYGYLFVFIIVVIWQKAF